MPTLTTNTPEVAYLMERDWRLRHLIEAVGDLSYEVSGSAFEHVAHSVIEQMLSMKTGRRIEGRLRELCCGEITGEAVLSLSVEEIRSCGVAAKKAITLHELAQRLPEHKLISLAELPNDEVRKTLMEIHGIGKWTADMFLIFYLERPDILPLEDKAIQQVFYWLYGEPITNESVRNVICPLWHPYTSIAVRYMYRALNEGLLEKGPSEKVLLY